MDFRLKISVHNFSEGEFYDRILVKHSKYYGINGKDVIEPLQKINGKAYNIKNVTKDYSI